MISAEQAKHITSISEGSTFYVYQLNNILTDILYACCRGKSEIIVGEKIQPENKKILIDGGYSIETSCEQEKDSHKHMHRRPRDEYKTIIKWGEDDG